MKPFNYLLPVSCLSISLLLGASIHCGSHNPTVKQQMRQQQYWDYFFYTSSGWPIFAYITTPVPPETRRDETHDLQIALQIALVLPCFFFYTSGTPHTRHNRARFKLWGRLFRSSLLASFFFFFFFFFFLLWKEFNSHSFVVTFHSSRSFVRLTTSFLPSRGRLLYSRRRLLFHLHIQHAICYLFERQTPVGSSEATVSGFCLSISLQSVSKQICTIFWLLNDVKIKCSLKEKNVKFSLKRNKSYGWVYICCVLVTERL